MTEITSTNMTQPPPCGHMNGTHPSSCRWLDLGDVWVERERIRRAVERLLAEEWRECGGACHDTTIAAVLRIIEGETP